MLPSGRERTMPMFNDFERRHYCGRLVRNKHNIRLPHVPDVLVESLCRLGDGANVLYERAKLAAEDTAPVSIPRLTQHRIWKHVILEFIPVNISFLSALYISLYNILEAHRPRLRWFENIRKFRKP
eukprot:1190820-Prorocentrum_minimum.AAC.4